MTQQELKALISLLDDPDPEVHAHVWNKIKSLGSEIVPLLEDTWENTLDSAKQQQLEDLVHDLQFEQLIQRLKRWLNGDQQDLLEGMWIISTFLYPDLSLQKLKKQLEQIYYDIWIKLQQELHPLDEIKIFNGVFYQDQGFRANTKNFYSPQNSMISHVLESKRGNPLSLCVIYMLLAQKLNLPIYGVNLPNLFILLYQHPEAEFYINAFNKGLIFSRNDIDNYLHQLNIDAHSEYYSACTHKDILRRVLLNLIQSYQKLGDTERIEELQSLLKLFKSSID